MDIVVSIDRIAYASHKASGTLEVYKADLINKLVRKKYKLPAYELAIMRKIIAEPNNAEYIAEFNEYNAYVEKCKTAVNVAFADMEWA